VFGISRGFRRLSVLLGILGFLLPALWYAIDSQHSRFPILMGTDYTPDVESFTQRILVLAGFTFIPMLLTLLVGWVVAGFRKPN
jgi:hypothetical protein